MGRPLHRLPADRGPRWLSRRRRRRRGPRRPAARHDRRRPGGRRDPRGHRDPDAARPVRPPGRRRFLKAESLQPIGAFKIRGAYVAVALADAPTSGPAASSPTRPATTPRASPAPPACSARRRSSSCRRTRRRSSGRGSRPTAPRSSSSARRATSASAVAEEIAAERGLAIIPPFDDDRIIAGQGTVGLEIVEDLPDVAAVLVPIGGGGLASGVAVGGPGAGARRAGDRRRAGARRRRAGVARARAGSSAGRAELVSRTIADGTRTTGARRADVRPPLGAARRHRHGDRGRDRRRRPARRRGEPARRRAVGRAVRSRRWPSSGRARLGLGRASTARSSPSSPAATSTRSATGPCSRRRSRDRLERRGHAPARRLGRPSGSAASVSAVSRSEASRSASVASRCPDRGPLRVDAPVDRRPRARFSKPHPADEDQRTSRR